LFLVKVDQLDAIHYSPLQTYVIAQPLLKKTASAIYSPVARDGLWWA